MNRATKLHKMMLLGSLLAGAGLTGAGQAWASGRAIAIEAGSGRLLTLSGAANNVYAADPKVVEVKPASATSLFVFGLSPGHTSVAATDGSGHAVGEYSIDVVPSSFAARATQHMIDHDPEQAGLRTEPRANGVALAGQAETPAEDQAGVAEARSAIGKDDQIDNRTRVAGSIQVNLRVRIAEMSRTLTRELGVNWQSTNTLGSEALQGVSFQDPVATLGAAESAISFISRFKGGARRATLDTIIDALSQDQLVKMLAEPNLTTLSGEPASFLVGGEFPIPIADQNNTITITFKQYGISLAFVPTVLSDGEISLHVRPEVSELTTQGAVSLSEGNSAIQIPALTVRRADTTVVLGSGQSFAIAGLLQDNTTDTGLGLPVLSDLPILGALFRSDSFQRNESELVIVVTPYIVKPAASPAVLHLPTDGYQPPNDIERLLRLRQTGARVAGAGSVPHVPGDAGFLVE